MSSNTVDNAPASISPSTFATIARNFQGFLYQATGAKEEEGTSQDGHRQDLETGKHKEEEQTESPGATEKDTDSTSNGLPEEGLQQQGEEVKGADEDQSSPDDSESPVPDGGLWAWLQVISGFLLYLNAWGMVTSFGVFQEFYRMQFIPKYSNTEISWIGTVQGFLLAFTSIFAGPVLDRGHPHWLILGGGFFVVFGLMMTSLCTKYWQLILAQGVVTGVGMGAIFIVAVAIIPGWFSKRRALTTGLCATGSSVGAIVYPIIFHRLEPQIGFGWTVRVMGFIALATSLVSLAVVKMRTKPPPRARVVDFTGFRELLFTFFAIVSFTGAMGLYIPFFFIIEYAAQKSHLNPNLSVYMLPVMSAGSIVGRTVPAVLADKYGSLRVLTVTTSTSALLAFCWIAIADSAPGLIIWSLLYGTFSGAFVSLQTPTVAAITPDIRMVGGRMGMNNFCLALGVLVGNPIAGAINGMGSWAGMQAFCGTTLTISAGLTGAMLYMTTKRGHMTET